MQARKLRWMGAITSLLFAGANYRTENFLVSASTPQEARVIAESAEQYRTQLAIEWLGQLLSRWDELCVIRAAIDPRLAPGGQTSFYFVGRQPRGWEMFVQGSAERVLDSVLPHEITHTILATHFGRPLPRWADEGACTTVEHASERAKQQKWLVEFLTSRPSRGIPFNVLFHMKEYPPDILPLYSQGYALAEFLIAQGGKRHFVDYLAAGMATNNWNEATRKFYGYPDLSALQTAWVAWVARGRPEPIPDDLRARPVPWTPVLAAAEVSDPSSRAATVQATWTGASESYYDRRTLTKTVSAPSEHSASQRLTTAGQTRLLHASRPTPTQRVELLVLEPVGMAGLDRR